MKYLAEIGRGRPPALHESCDRPLLDPPSEARQKWTSVGDGMFGGCFPELPLPAAKAVPHYDFRLRLILGLCDLLESHKG
eukprot:14987296-Heterocapsa_arctica.AAC.1